MGKIFRALEKSNKLLSEKGNARTGTRPSAKAERLSGSRSSSISPAAEEREGAVSDRINSSASSGKQGPSHPSSRKTVTKQFYGQEKTDSAFRMISPESRPTPSGTFPGAVSQAQPLHDSVVVHHRPHSPEAEQFRMLKTTILFPDKGTPPRTIMITSSAAGEGKSFVAANLAASMANGIDEHVLLMDCDLRRPTLHQILGFPDNIPGLTEYLTEGLPLPELLKKTRIRKLTFLPCGTPPPNPSELIFSDQMRKLLHEVKSRYSDRYIIIDAPPPDVTAEANALARLVDAIVIVVKIGHSKKRALKDIVETYGREKILGVVKNFAERTKSYNYGA